MSTISETPKIKVYKEDSSKLLTGEGGEVPIFIGATGNSSPNSAILEFKNYKEATAAPNATKPGIGPEAATNYMLPIIKDFLEETFKINSDDIGVPHIFVKDLGEATAATAAPWTTAKEDSRKKADIQVEAYVFKSTDALDKIIDILTAVAASLKEDTRKGKPRIAYATVQGWTDEQLKTLTQGTNEVTKNIRDVDIAIIEYHKFGKQLARICTTPYYDEPGYYEYRSVSAGTFTERTDDEEEELQEKGIIFSHDEKPGKIPYPKINLAVSTAHAIPEDERPKLSLIHANRNVNQLIRDAMEVIYPQLKRRETETFIQEVQADLDLLCGDKIKAGYMKEGTEVTAVEYLDSPYTLKLKVKASPVNITGIIETTVYV